VKNFVWVAFLTLGYLGSVGAFEPTKLTDSQKLSIRSAQVELLTVQVQQQQLEKQWADLNVRRNAAQEKLNAAMKAAVVDGYDLQEQGGDLVLVAKPKPPEGKK
jgi:hypothetical protein